MVATQAQDAGKAGEVVTSDIELLIRKQIPEMKICPSAANSLNSLYWMFQAEVANKLKNSGAKNLFWGEERCRFASSGNS